MINERNNPCVFFADYLESSILFKLYVTVKDVNQKTRVKSNLLFGITGAWCFFANCLFSIKKSFLDFGGFFSKVFSNSVINFFEGILLSSLSFRFAFLKPREFFFILLI